MLTIVQLRDGCYKVTIDYTFGDSVRIYREYIFRLAESDAEPDEDGERIIIDLTK